MALTKDYIIDRSSDDIHAVVGGTWDLTQSQTILGTVGGDVYEAHFRWLIDIPKYAKITRTTVQWTSDAADGSAASLRIFLLNYDDAEAADWNTDPRPLELSPIYRDWEPASWADAELVSSVDIGYLVQSFIDRPGYVKGNHFGIVIRSLESSGTLRRRPRSFDTGTSAPARLIVTYEKATSNVNTPDGRSTRIEIQAPGDTNITHWQIFTEEQKVTDTWTSKNPYPIGVSSEDSARGNVTSVGKDHVSIWYPPNTQYKVRWRFDDGTWSDVIHFTSIGYLTSYDRYRILSGLI